MEDIIAYVKHCVLGRVRFHPDREHSYEICL